MQNMIIAKTLEEIISNRLLMFWNLTKIKKIATKMGSFSIKRGKFWYWSTSFLNNKLLPFLHEIEFKILSSLAPFHRNELSRAKNTFHVTDFTLQCSLVCLNTKNIIIFNQKRGIEIKTYHTNYELSRVVLRWCVVMPHQSFAKIK